MVHFDEDEENGAEAGEDFGSVSNLIDENNEEEEDLDAEEEFEKSLPAIARFSQRTIANQSEEKLLDLETLAFPEGIFNYL